MAAAPGAADLSGDIEFTGERFIPGTRGEIWVEHWHRYHFAARWAKGLRVLDAACGEGYGTALLARHAAHVTGVDLSPDAIAHARRTYANLANAEFIEASIAKLPLPGASFDVVVSFETVEHIPVQQEFIAEVARVLKPGGVLVMSCPNKLEYSDKRHFDNPFHVKELYREELAALVAQRFPEVRWYGQRPSFFSVIAPESNAASGELIEVVESAPGEAGSKIENPLYFLIVAGITGDAVDRVPPPLSVLSDRDEWVHRDYEKVMRDLGGCAREREHAITLVEERDGAIAFMTRDILEWKKLKEDADARYAEGEAWLRRQIAERDEQLRAQVAVIEAKDRELTRRGGLRWWLLLPLYRFGILKHPPV